MEIMDIQNNMREKINLEINLDEKSFDKKRPDNCNWQNSPDPTNKQISKKRLNR